MARPASDSSRTTDDKYGPLGTAAQERARLVAAFHREDALQAENDRVRKAMEDAINIMGPGDDEDSDSIPNMVFAILSHGLEQR